MASADEFGLTDEQFQFYKEKLQKSVKEYLDLEEQITALKKAAKERTESRKKVSADILDTMKKLELNHMNIKDGKLVYKETNSFKTITQKNLADSLVSVFNNDDIAAQQAFKKILENREKVTKVELKHVKARKKNGLTL